MSLGTFSFSSKPWEMVFILIYSNYLFLIIIVSHPYQDMGNSQGISISSVLWHRYQSWPVCQVLSRCLSMHLLHVSPSPTPFLDHCNACLMVLPGGFHKVCPIHLHLPFPGSSSMGACSALFDTSSFLILFSHLNLCFPQEYIHKCLHLIDRALGGCPYCFTFGYQNWPHVWIYLSWLTLYMSSTPFAFLCKCHSFFPIQFTFINQFFITSQAVTTDIFLFTYLFAAIVVKMGSCQQGFVKWM